jgi:hypothetical protein
MIKNRIFAPLAAAALLVAGAAPAFAKSQDSQGNGSVASAEDKGARKICKRLQNSGTRLRNDRICLTATEWRKVEAQN